MVLLELHQVPRVSRTEIDNILTNVNHKQYVTDIVACSFSDHYAQSLSWNINSKSLAQFKHTSRKINEETLFSFNALLANENWEEITTETNPDKAFHNFSQILSHLFDIACPLTTRTIRTRKKFWNPKINQLEAQITILNHSLHNSLGNKDELKNKIKQTKLELKQACDISIIEHHSQSSEVK